MFRFAFLVVCAFTTAPVLAEETGCKTEDGKTVPVNTQVDIPGHCSLHKCDGNEQWITASCGLIGLPEGWVLVDEDTSKPYPKCCGYAVPPLDIIPDVLDKTPGQSYLHLTYKGGLKVKLGNELTPTQVRDEPEVDYEAKPEEWYLLAMVDPDAPSRQTPTNREFLHWIVGNIQGKNIASGETLAGYRGSGPPKGTGLHRYVFLLYKQPGKLSFDEPRVPKDSREHRPLFSIRKFAKKYNLGEPVAINVFQAQHEG